jgi:hypothetical protein
MMTTFGDDDYILDVDHNSDESPLPDLPSQIESPLSLPSRTHDPLPYLHFPCNSDQSPR